VKAYWAAVGLGTLAVVIGGVVYFTSDHKFGLIVILTGLVVAILGLMMRLVQWAMDRSK
jgi:hypothetical protein